LTTMPSEHVHYDVLSEAAHSLVDVAGQALLKTTYPFASPSSLRRRARPSAVSALEQAFAPQRRPQRTIVGALSAAAGVADNNEVSSSVGQLWRDGWRCERDVAQHQLRFIREAPPGQGPSGEIGSLRSYADFAQVLMEWYAIQILAVSPSALTSALPAHALSKHLQAGVLQYDAGLPGTLEHGGLPKLLGQAPSEPVVLPLAEPLSSAVHEPVASPVRTKTEAVRAVKRSRFFAPPQQGSGQASAPASYMSSSGHGNDGLGLGADGGG